MIAIAACSADVKDGGTAMGNGGNSGGAATGGSGVSADGGISEAGVPGSGTGGSTGGVSASGGSTNAGTGGATGSGSGGTSSASGGSTSASGGRSGGTGGTSGGSGGSGGIGTPGTGGRTSTGGAAGSSNGGALGSGGAGTGGRGGATGQGGSAGRAAGGAAGASAGSGGTAGGGAASGACPANAIFCADFEGGAIPAQAAFFPEYLRPMISSYVTVDPAVSFRGNGSARFAGTSFSQMLGVSTGTARFWTRVYLRSDVDMSTVTGHATYVAAAEGNGDPNMGEQVRVGEHICQLELNRRSDDKELLSNGGAYMCMGGIVLAKNSWYCLETFYDGPGREVRVFVDSVESPALHATDWGPYAYSMFKFGFENYSSPARTMWYDEAAVAPQRIGCY